jgi:hypothetical protein
MIEDMVASVQKPSESRSITIVLGSVDWPGARILAIGSNGDDLWLQVELASGVTVYLIFVDWLYFSCSAKAFSSPLAEYMIIPRTKLVDLMYVTYYECGGIAPDAIRYKEIQLWSEGITARPVFTVVAGDAKIASSATGFEIHTGGNRNLFEWEHERRRRDDRKRFPPSIDPSWHEMYEYPGRLEQLGTEDAFESTIYVSPAAVSYCLKLWDEEHAVLVCRDWLYCEYEMGAGCSTLRGFTSTSATPLAVQLISESIDGIEERQSALERYKELQLHEEDDINHPVLTIVASEQQLIKFGRQWPA